ncbi:MAG: SIMPL domain-containing protein, partial [Acetobacteraceae bacterium]
PEATRTTRAAALRQAISGLRARAEEAAGLLGLRFASFRTVRLNPEPQRVFPMMTRAAAAPPPNVEQGPLEVSATVTAEAVLVGK